MEFWSRVYGAGLYGGTLVLRFFLALFQMVPMLIVFRWPIWVAFLVVVLMGIFGFIGAIAQPVIWIVSFIIALVNPPAFGSTIFYVCFGIYMLFLVMAYVTSCVSERKKYRQ